jgi:hypothetical protein
MVIKLGLAILCLALVMSNSVIITNCWDSLLAYKFDRLFSF